MTAALRSIVPAETTEVAGRVVASHYGDPTAEYGAAMDGALVVDRSHRTRMTFTGAARADTLTGLVTNDVKALLPGSGQYAAALTPKGKILADVRVFARDEDVLVDAPPRASAGFLAMIRKYVNPRVTPYVDQSSTLGDLTVLGPRAAERLGGASGIDPELLGVLAPFGHLHVRVGEADATIARIPDAGVDGFTCFAADETLAALTSRLTADGARPGGLSAFEMLRVEAGRPEWGLDIDDSTIPQEANLDALHAISYTKGCYTGQETVARVHFRGHVNRRLCGLRLTAPVPRGARVEDAGGKDVGDARSAVISPRFGPIAIAMLRREVEPGAAVRVRWEDDATRAIVVDLPFAER